MKQFLIQSDFVTKASRDAAVINPWNSRLLSEAALAFDHNIGSFLSHFILKYQWIRYIPIERVPDDFWTQLRTKILDTLKTRKAFFSQDNQTLRRPDELRIVPQIYREESGQPLLAESGSVRWAGISENYDTTIDGPILRKLGVRDMDAMDFLFGLSADLNSASSRMFSSPINDSWHAQVVELLVNLMADPNFAAIIRLFPVVPLDNGRWVLALNASIFFPKCDGIDIPTDLPVNLVRAEASQSPTWRRFLGKLGISECAPSKIIPLIEQRYLSLGRTMDESLNHVAFLFWHHKELLSQSISIRLIATKAFFSPYDTTTGWVYCPRSEDQYAVCNLLDQEKLNDKMKLLNLAYYTRLEKLDSRHNITPVDWLHSYFQIKTYPQLCRRDDPNTMSAELEYVRNHKPGFLVGTLNHSWCQLRAAWDKTIKLTEVPIWNSVLQEQVCRVFLPSPNLKAIATRLGLDKNFKFLGEHASITDAQASSCSVLNRLGVGVNEDLSFWIELLQQARRKGNPSSKVIFEIYSQLQKLCCTEDDIQRIK